MIKILLFTVGFILGILLRKHEKITKWASNSTFYIAVPLIAAIEFSSIDYGSWFYIPLGSIFVVGLFYFGIIIGFDRHKSALLATAEGGTLGFVLYVLLDKEPISKFMLIDMLGNGIMFFTFIYYNLSKKIAIKSFGLNPIIIAIFTGFLLNLYGIKLIDYKMVNIVEDLALFLLIFLLAWIIGAGFRFGVSLEIVVSPFFKLFWIIRLLGAGLSQLLQMPLALCILFLLPPSFLLPVIYRAREDNYNRLYASNFIAMCLPVYFFLSTAIIIYEFY